MSAESSALIALRQRRESALQLLTECFANDLIDLPTLDLRTSAALEALTVAEVEGLVADLVPLEKRSSADGSRPKVTAVFSSIERRGPWTVPTSLGTRAVFGNVELDFRHASFSPGVTDLEVHAIFGNVEIVVPPEVAVECDGKAVFATFEHGAAPVPDRRRPLLRIRGSAVFGNVEVSTRGLKGT